METTAEYAMNLTEPGHYTRAYRNANSVMTESQLQQAALTQFRFNNQLFTRPYAGNFMGAGQPSMTNKDTETELFTGIEARVSKSSNMPGITIDRFDYLPAYGNPQRAEHIIPVWVRGGEATRDFVRRKLHSEKCAF